MGEENLSQTVRDCIESSDPEVWARFIRTFHRLIASTVVKCLRRFETPTPDTTDDLIQETYLRLCADNRKILRNIRADTPAAVYALIQSVAIATVYDYGRARSAAKRGGGAVTVSLDSPDAPQAPVTSKQLDPERQLLFREIEEALVRSTSGENAVRDRAIFWLYYRHGFTAAAIAALPSVSLAAKGVETLLSRLTAEVRQRMNESPRANQAKAS